MSLYNAFEINQTTCKPSKVVLLTVLSKVLLDEDYCVCSMSIHRISDIFSVIDLYSKSYTFIVLLNVIKTPVWTSCICKVRKGCCWVQLNCTCILCKVELKTLLVLSNKLYLIKQSRRCNSLLHAIWVWALLVLPWLIFDLRLTETDDSFFVLFVFWFWQQFFLVYLPDW